jgi:hypothetical protein
MSRTVERLLFTAIAIALPASADAQHPPAIDVAASVGPQWTTLSLGGVSGRRVLGTAVHLAPRINLGAVPWTRDLRVINWLRIEAPSIELGVNHFKGISLAHPDTGFAYFDYRAARVELRPFDRLGIFVRGGQGMRTMERVEGATNWNYIGSGSSHSIGVFARVLDDHGLSFQIGKLTGDFYRRETGEFTTEDLVTRIPFSARTATLEWSGRFTGAGLPRIPLFDHERTWSLRFENDAFGGTHSDSAYTQGLQLRWDVSYYQPWVVSLTRAVSLTWLISALDRPGPVECAEANSSKRLCTMIHFGAAQTEYTPDDIHTAALLPAQRPYAGYLYAFGGTSVVYPTGRISTELQVGTTGRLSLGEDGQSLAHWTWAAHRGRPAGWANQLAGAAQFLFVTQYEKEALRACWGGFLRLARCPKAEAVRAFDVTGRAQTDFGTVMNRLSPGIAVRVGANYPAASSFQRIPGTLLTRFAMAPRIQPIQSQCSSNPGQGPFLVASGSFDERFVLTNGLIDGTYRDDDGWSALKEISAVGRVDEWSIGAQAGYRWFTAGYQLVQRSGEYTPSGGRHRYGALMFGITSSCRRRS